MEDQLPIVTESKTYQTIISEQKQIIDELRNENDYLIQQNNNFQELNNNIDMDLQRTMITQYEEKLQNLENQLKEKDNSLNEFKEQMLKDFTYKENKILDLHNQITDIEDDVARYQKIIGMTKDKKKYNETESKNKALSKELHRV